VILNTHICQSALGRSHSQRSNGLAWHRDWGEDVGEIQVEVRPGPGAYGEDLSGKPVLPEAFTKRADEIAESIVEIANSFRDRLEVMGARREELEWRMKEVKLSFGLDLEAESGVLIVRAKAGCTFTATLSWAKEHASG